ncbi:metallophosphoesterase, partial [Streptomyces sp. NPDC058664]
MKFAVRLMLLLLVPALMFGLPWWMLVSAPTGGSGALFWIGTAICLAGAVCLPLAMFLGHGPAQSDPAVIVGDTLLGVVWVVFSWSVIGVFARGALAVAGVDGAQIVAVGVLVTSAVLIGWGVFEARRVPRVRTVDVAIRGLAEGLDGLRVVVVTDTHYAALNRQRWSE